MDLRQEVLSSMSNQRIRKMKTILNLILSFMLSTLVAYLAVLKLIVLVSPNWAFIIGMSSGAITMAVIGLPVFIWLESRL